MSLRHPRQRSEGKVAEWSPQVEDFAATLTQALIFYQSCGRKDTGPAACRKETDPVPNDLVRHVRQDERKNGDGAYGPRVVSECGGFWFWIDTHLRARVGESGVYVEEGRSYSFGTCPNGMGARYSQSAVALVLYRNSMQRAQTCAIA
jgi:hypothetical protein